MHWKSIQDFTTPFDASTFFKTIWGKEATVLSPTNILDTLSPVDWFTSLLSHRDAQYPAVRLSTNRGDADVLAYTLSTGRRFDPRIRVDAVLSILRGEDVTLRISELSKLDGGIESACRSLSTIFGCRVEMNGYLTINAARGVAAHYDSHHIFAHQLTGVKDWCFGSIIVKSPTAEYHPTPLESQPFTQRARTLEGMTVYIPPGMWHEASCSGVSLHLSIGIHTPTWESFIVDAVKAASQKHWILRSATPMIISEGKCSYRMPRLDELRQAMSLIETASESAGNKVGTSNRNDRIDEIALIGLGALNEHETFDVLKKTTLEIWANCAAPQAIVVRGSAAQVKRDHEPWDIDFVVVSKCDDLQKNEASAEAIRFWYESNFPSAPDLDISILTLSQLNNDPKSIIKRYLLVNEGLLVMGHISSGDIRHIELNAETANQILARSVDIAFKKIAEAELLLNYRSLRHSSTMAFKRAAKAALRLPGALSFLRLGRLERNPAKSGLLASDWPDEIKAAVLALSAEFERQEFTTKDVIEHSKIVATFASLQVFS